MKKLITSFVFAVGAICAYAQSFEYGGLNYNVLSEEEKTCEVVPSYDVSGHITVPSTVKYNGGQYTVTSIGDYAFSYCESLTSITLPAGVTSIGNSAFYNCYTLTSITLPESITTIENYAFYCCLGLTSITLPESLTSIGHYAFYYCPGLTSITLPESLTLIGSYAFYYCGITSITLPESLTSIGDLAFAMCENLSTVNSYATTPPLCGYNNVFYGIPSDAVLHVPVGFKDDYASAYGWSEFNNIVDDLIVQSGIVEIEDETETAGGDAADTVVVYNLQGLRMNISRRSDINALPSGIYIVNGNKTLIK